MTPLSNGAPAVQGTGQRRHLTILFADLSDSTSLAEAMEAEHYAAMLASLRGLYQAIVVQHGGTVVRIQGDGMLAIFGYPAVSEDDGRRATEAALALHEAVRALRPADFPTGRLLRLHSGIHAGLVLMDEGDDVRGRFELLGNAPNIAARLSDLAGVDELLVSEETLGLQRHFFHTGERRQLQLRGRSAALAAFAIHGRAAGVTRRFEASVQRGLAPFVGRAGELAQLQQLFGEAMSGSAHWVNISGGAGVGKTRLTEEFLRRAAARPDCQIHRGGCESTLSAEPLQPYWQMLAGRPEAELARQSPPYWRLKALEDVFVGLARQAPQLLFIDDLQWADDASLALLHRLRRRAAAEALPMLLLCATRPLTPQDAIPAIARADDGHALLLVLRPFNDLEADEAVTQLLPGTDPFLAAEIQRQAGGNALFIEELCHALAFESAPRQLGRVPAGTAWLTALVESRVARLPAAQLELLRVAAVIGNTIPRWLLERISAAGPRDPALRALAEQDFVFPDKRADQLRFKHGITRDAVYETIGLYERQALHRRIAAELRAHGASTAQPAAHELLAYHDGAAGDWLRAAEHAEQAGDEALAASAMDRAKKQYRAVLAALENLPEGPARDQRWILIAQRFGLACVFDASRADLRVLQHAARLAHASEDQALIARADYWLGYVCYALGEARSGLEHCERGLAAAGRCTDPALTAQLRGTLGQLHAAATDYVPALALLDEAIHSQRESRHAGRGARSPVGLAYSLTCRAYVLGDQGRFALAHEAFEEALALMGGSNHAVEASIQAWRAAVYLWQGRWSEAQGSAAEAQRIGSQVRSVFTFSMGHATSAYGAWMANGAANAAQLLQDATAWLVPRGGGLFSSLNHGWLAEMLGAQGQRAPARQHVAQALRRARQQDWLGAAMAYRAAASLAARPELAARYLEQAAEVARRRGAAPDQALNALCAAELALAAGRPAAALLDRAATGFQALGMPWHLARLERLAAAPRPVAAGR